MTSSGSRSGAPPRVTPATDRLQRLLALVPVRGQPEGGRAGRDRGRVRRQRARAGRRPQHAVVRRAALARPLLPDRPVLRGRRDRGQRGRVDRPAAAARRRRGERAAGRAADAGRGARPGGPLGAEPDDRQAGGRRRGGGRGERPGRGAGRRPRRRQRAAQVRDALGRGRRLHLSYYVPGRDEATERDVDPMRLLVVEGRTYLEGWCLRAEAVRLFRLDRVLALDVLDEPAVGAAPGPSRGTWTRGCSGRPPTTCGWSSSCRWRAGGWPSTTRASEVTELGDGRLRVGLRTPDTRWVRRLALRLGEDGRVIAPAGAGRRDPGGRRRRAGPVRLSG